MDKLLSIFKYFFTNPIITVSITLITSYLSFSGKISMTTARFCLIAAWLLSIVGFYFFRPILNQPLLLRCLITMLCISLYGIALYFLDQWRPPQSAFTSQRQLRIKMPNNRLTPFSGIKVFLHWRADDNESSIFTNNLESCLTKSGWEVTRSAPHIADSSISNVIIEINEKLDLEDRAVDAASVLAKFLKINKIVVIIIKNANNPLPANAMYIRIGPIR